jgi:hypothetical protein
MAQTVDEVTISIVTRIEALEGRFAFIQRAADGASLMRAQAWLERNDAELASLPLLPFKYRVCDWRIGPTDQVKR